MRICFPNPHKEGGYSLECRSLGTTRDALHRHACFSPETGLQSCLRGSESQRDPSACCQHPPRGHGNTSGRNLAPARPFPWVLQIDGAARVTGTRWDHAAQAGPPHPAAGPGQHADGIIGLEGQGAGVSVPSSAVTLASPRQSGSQTGIRLLEFCVSPNLPQNNVPRPTDRPRTAVPLEPRAPPLACQRPGCRRPSPDAASSQLVTTWAELCGRCTKGRRCGEQAQAVPGGLSGLSVGCPPWGGCPGAPGRRDVTV